MKVSSVKGDYELRALPGDAISGEYRFHQRTSALNDGSGNAIASVTIDPISPVPLPGSQGGSAHMSCVGVLDSEVMEEMQLPWNADAYFVVPARLNGTAMPDNRTAFRVVDQYVDWPAGSTRAQIAIHPGVAQFFLDNCHSGNIDSSALFCKNLEDVGLKAYSSGGFLHMPARGGLIASEGPVALFLGRLHDLGLICVRNVPVCGLTPNLSEFSNNTHSVNIVFVTAFPPQPEMDPHFHNRVAEGYLAAQYFGAMMLAYKLGHRKKVFLMPAGTSNSGHSLEMIANSMSCAVEMLSETERNALDIQALTWIGNYGECTALSEALARRGKLSDGSVQKDRAYGPDGMRYSGFGHYEADGTHFQHEHSGMKGDGRLDNQGVEVEECGSWFRADNGRQDQEIRGARNISAIVGGVEELWKKGLCPEQMWTNDRDKCNLPGLPEDVADFSTDDDSLLVPRMEGGSNRVVLPIVGDHVQIISENPKGEFDPNRVGTVGRTGTVVKTETSSDGLLQFRVDLGSGHISLYDHDWVALDLGRPKRGDRVQIYIENTPSNFDAERRGTNGKIGRVARDYGPARAAYDIVLNGSRCLKYDDSWVAKLGHTPETGEQVKILQENPMGHFEPSRAGTVDCIGVVTQAEGSSLPFAVFMPQGMTLEYAEDWIVRAPPDRLRVAMSPMIGGENFMPIIGDYELHQDQEWYGYPTWAQTFDATSRMHGQPMTSCMHMIHTDSKGRWAIINKAENQTVLVSRPHGGRYPQSVSQWGFVRTGSFLPVQVRAHGMMLVLAPHLAPQPSKRQKNKSGCGGCSKATCVACSEAYYCVPGCEGKPQKHAEDDQAPVPIPTVWMLDPGHELPPPAKQIRQTRRWMRLSDFSDFTGAGNLFRDPQHETHCGRIFQSSLENAYFVEALNAITLRPRLVRRLFYAWNSKTCAFAVRLFKNGTWICVEVDDYVPVRDQGGEEHNDDKPFCCYSEHFPGSLWPSIVEKAYAKACTLRDHGNVRSPNNSGGWEALGGGGRVDEALVDLTGGVASSFSTREVTSERLFVYLYELQRETLFVCRVHLAHCARNGVHLNPHANYSVNRAAHFEGNCYVQVFCSSPDGIFSGGLDDFVIIPIELRQRYREKTGDGFFWMRIEDFHFYFDTIFECRLANSPDVGLDDLPPSRHVGLGGEVSVQPGLAAPENAKVLSGMPLEEPLHELPIFYEHVFANSGVITERRPPEFTVILPNADCEVIATVEQTCPRITQVGPKRHPHVAIVLKVYEEIGRDIYSDELVCKSAWMPVRGAMVAFKSTRGGTYKLVAEMLAGERCDKMLFRCYSSAPSTTVSAASGLGSHSLAKPVAPTKAIRWTLVGSVLEKRLPRTDMPLPAEDDLDTFRRKEHEPPCFLM